MRLLSVPSSFKFDVLYHPTYELGGSIYHELHFVEQTAWASYGAHVGPVWVALRVTVSELRKIVEACSTFTVPAVHVALPLRDG